MPSIIDLLLNVGSGIADDIGGAYDRNIAPGFRGVGDLMQLAGTDGLTAAFSEAGNRIEHNLFGPQNRPRAFNPGTAMGVVPAEDRDPRLVLREIAQTTPGGEIALSALDSIDEQNQSNALRAWKDLSTKVMYGDRGVEARQAALSPFVPDEMKESLGTYLGDAVSNAEMLPRMFPTNAAPEGHARLINDHLTGGNFSQSAKGTQARADRAYGWEDPEAKKRKEREEAFAYEEKLAKMRGSIDSEKEITREYVKGAFAAGKSSDEVADGLIKLRAQLRGEAPAEETQPAATPAEAEQGGLSDYILPALATAAAVYGGKKAHAKYSAKGGKAMSEAKGAFKLPTPKTKLDPKVMTALGDMGKGKAGSKVKLPAAKTKLDPQVMRALDGAIKSGDLKKLDTRGWNIDPKLDAAIKSGDIATIIKLKDELELAKKISSGQNP